MQMECLIINKICKYPIIWLLNMSMENGNFSNIGSFNRPIILSLFHKI